MTIRVEHLSYSRGKFQLSCDNLTMESGKVTSIIGKNGSGKSTFLKLLNGGLQAGDGRILIDEKQVESIPLKELSRKISFLQQEVPDPMGFSVREVMSVSGYTREQNENDMIAALSLFEAESLINRKYSDLSGGERRIAALAATIYQDSEIIIMDEPTTFLDVDKQILVNDVIENLRRNGKTVIIVMHDLSTVYSISDNVILMKEGSVIGFGDTMKVMSPDLLEQAFDVEFEVFDTPAGREFKGHRQLASQR